MGSASRLIKDFDAVLLLEDGSEFLGHRFGCRQSSFGEVIFNTGMVGYQEVLTDPSYWQQIVVMTYPHQGNYGINSRDIESLGPPKVAGFVVHELSQYPSNYESEESLEAYLSRSKIAGLTGVDTRSLTLHLRDRGVMRGLILGLTEKSELLAQKTVTELFKNYPLFEKRDLIKEVTTTKPYWFSEGFNKTVVVLDFGVKLNLLREIKKRNVNIVVLPAQSTAQEVLSYQPDGVFLSNGPGDPAVATYAIETVRTLLGKKPIFGVCMGHQILALALGGKTYKMKFGHRGINQPVFNFQDQRVEISSHNHGFSVAADSFDSEAIAITHINLNDRTCEGLASKKYNAFSVQYHPESAPGPHDSDYLFDQFVAKL